MDVYLIDKDVRLDIDLSAKDGTMNYAAGAAAQAVKPTEKKGEATPSVQPSGDADLAKLFSGKYYSYTGGSTLSGGGARKVRSLSVPTAVISKVMNPATMVPGNGVRPARAAPAALGQSRAQSNPGRLPSLTLTANNRRCNTRRRVNEAATNSVAGYIAITAPVIEKRTL